MPSSTPSSAPSRGRRWSSGEARSETQSRVAGLVHQLRCQLVEVQQVELVAGGGAGAGQAPRRADGHEVSAEAERRPLGIALGDREAEGLAGEQGMEEPLAGADVADAPVAGGP